MQKERNEPLADMTLSYADIELILTSLEHYVPRTTLAKNRDTMELISLFKRNESRLFKAIKEAKQWKKQTTIAAIATIIGKLKSCK